MATVLEKESGLAPEVVAGVATNETAAEDEKQRVNPVPERKRKQTKPTIRDMQKPEPLGQTAIEDPYSNVEGWIQGQPEVAQKNQSPIGEKSIEDQRKENEAYWKQREAEEAERARQQSRRLEQDRDQWQQTQQRKDTRRYKEDVQQYGKDMKVYEHDVKEYEKAKAEYDKDLGKYHSELDSWMKKNKPEIYDAWSKKENKYEKAQGHVDAAVAKYESDVKKWEAQVKDAEKKDARWYNDIPSFNQSNAGKKYEATIDKYRYWQKKGLTSTVNKKYYELHGKSYLGYMRDIYEKQYQNKWGSKIAHNDALNKKYGGRPSVSIPSLGILSRTAADIIQGKSNVPLKQVSSHVYRQVAYYRLGQRYKNTNMTYNEFQQAKAQIYNTIYEKQSAEQARRNWSAAISAKSAAAKASEKHNLMLKDLNKQNRLAQMAAQTAQNAMVNAQLKKAGIDASKLKISQGKPQQLTNVSMVSPTPVQQGVQETPSKPRPAQPIFDIPHSEFAAIQAARGLTEEFKIGQWKSSEQGDFIKRKTESSTKPFDTSSTSTMGGVSPLLVNQYLKQMNQPKMQDQPPKPTWTVDGKIFNSYEKAQEYAEKTQSPIITGMTDLAPTKSTSVLDDKVYFDPSDPNKSSLSDFGQALKAGMWNALRFGDAVDLGETERKNIFDDILYYSSSGVKPIVDIPLSVSNLLGKSDFQISPSLSSGLTDIPIKGITEGDWVTPAQTFADYVIKDPLRTVAQLPAEAA